MYFYKKSKKKIFMLNMVLSSYVILLFSCFLNADTKKLKCKGENHNTWNDCIGSVAQNGTAYVGEFKNGLYNGKGTFTYSDGATYRGEFLNGKESGMGEFNCWEHGSNYKGEFRNGEKHGFGVYKYPDGVIYEGFWKLGKRHGEGTLKYVDGKIKNGNFEDDYFIDK